MREQPMSRANIRLKAMAVFRHGGKVLVNEVRESDNSLIGFRIPGGHVEFGERAIETIVREVQEEIGAAITAPQPLGVVENVFTYKNTPCHEVIFVYGLDFIDKAMYDKAVIAAQEDDGSRFELLWCDPDSLPEGVSLFPTGLKDLL